MQRVEEETVLLDIDSGAYFAINDVASRVWDLCDGSHTIDAIVAAVLEEFDAPGDIIRTDVNDLLATLSVEQLITST